MTTDMSLFAYLVCRKKIVCQATQVSFHFKKNLNSLSNEPTTNYNQLNLECQVKGSFAFLLLNRLFSFSLKTLS